jgi:hypothetical protein
LMNIVWKVWNFGGDLVYVIESLVFQAENFRLPAPVCVKASAKVGAGSFTVKCSCTAVR